MARLELRLLGRLEILFDGAAWTFAVPPRAFGILGYLASHGGEAIPRATLATLIWPDDPEDEARGKLRRHLHRIVHGLPPCPNGSWIEVTASTVSWANHPQSRVDVPAFRTLAADAARAEEAIELYRGEYLEGFYDDWILLERERLQAEFLEICFAVANAARLERRFDAAVRYADRMLAIDEWREDAVRLAMTARYEKGDRSAALAVFERFAARLRAEMNVDPMPETLALRAAVLENAPLPGMAEEDGGEPGSAQKGAFVGRGADLESLANAWRRAARGAGTTILLGGMAGIGKSRLVSEFAALAASQGGRTLLGTTSSPQAFPYEPLVDALRRSLALIAHSGLEDAWLSALAEIVPELRGLRPDLPAAPELQPQAAGKRLIEAIVRALESLARVRPVLLVIEDAHWAQGATIDAIEAIARRAGSLPMLVVVTYRADEVAGPHPLAALRRALLAERRATASSLRGLTQSAVAELVRSTCPQAPATLAPAVYEVSEGNPLFATQLVRGFAETGEAPSATSALRTVGEVVIARLRELDAPVRLLAQAAAIVGRSFETGVVARILGWDEDETLDAIGTLLDRGIVREAGGAAFLYTFTHALIVAAIYESVEEPTRQLRHRRVAQILTERVESNPAELGTLARHWQLANEPERAAQAYLQAAGAALRVYARQEAMHLARLALELAGDPELEFDALRACVLAGTSGGDLACWDEDIARLERLGETLGDDRWFLALAHRRRFARQTADAPRQAATIATMMEIARRTGKNEHAMEALLAQGILQVQRAQLDVALDSFRAALPIAVAAADWENELRIRNHIVTALARVGDTGQAVAELEGIKAGLAQRSVPLQLQLEVVSTESTIAMVLEDAAWMARVGDQMLAMANVSGDVFLQAKSHFLRAHAAYSRFDFTTVREGYAQARALFDAIGERDAARVACSNAATMEQRIGRWDRAAELQHAMEGYEVESGTTFECVSLNARADVLVGLGRPLEALDLVRRSYEISTNATETRYVDETLVALAQAEAACGLLDDAIEHLRRALEGTRAREAWRDVIDVLSRLVDALVDAGRFAEAAPRAAELAEAFERYPDVVRPSFVCYALARYGLAAGSSAEAAAWVARGRKIVAAALANLSEPADARAFGQLPFNRYLLEAAPGGSAASGRGTRTVRRSS